MDKVDQKKLDNSSKRHDIANNILKIRNFHGYTSELRHALICGELDQKEETETLAPITCPFPNHKGYLEVWESISHREKKRMKKNINITADGKIEMMGRNFSILVANHNGKDIFEGDGNNGIKGISYLTGKASERECELQNKGMFSDSKEVGQFMSFIPGELSRQKVLNFVKLFGLDCSGYFDSGSNSCDKAGYLGLVSLSKPFYSDKYSQEDIVLQLRWGKNEGAYRTRNPARCAYQCIAYDNN